MIKFNIRIIKNDGSIVTYSDPYKIEINEDTIKVDYEDKSADHNLDQINEIIIEVNH